MFLILSISGEEGASGVFYTLSSSPKGYFLYFCKTLYSHERGAHVITNTEIVELEA